MTFGDKISKLRKEQNYTQEQLADILNVSRQSVSKWESNITYPETSTIIKISKLFSCTTEFLLKDDVIEKNDSNSIKHLNKIINEKNKKRFMKILKIFGIILAIFLVIDVVSLIICFSIGFF